MTALPLDRSQAGTRSDLTMQRGACPALSAPMMTGDGLLARVALTDAISPAQLIDLCRLARRHGNGMLDISARGNIQVRGLGETSAPRLAEDVRALALPLRDGLAVESPPLAGLDPSELADPRPLADAIRLGAQGITGLAPKISVVVDGRGQLRLSHLLADIRLVAIRTEDGIGWKILLGGTEANTRIFNVLRETLAVDATLALLRELAARGDKARGRDLASDLSLDDGASLATSPFGLFALSDELCGVGVAPAFGQTSSENIMALCEKAERLGIERLKPGLDHALIFFGSGAACKALAVFAGDHGFITSRTDPRSHIAACAGSPACRSATVHTHEIAAQAAAGFGDLLDGSFKLHVTGCRKGCAHPEPSALALCGTQNGLSLIQQGKAADQPFASIAFADTNATLCRLADLLSSERRAGENSAACLARLGAGRLAATVTSGRS